MIEGDVHQASGTMAKLRPLGGSHVGGAGVRDPETRSERSGAKLRPDRNHSDAHADVPLFRRSPSTPWDTKPVLGTGWHRGGLTFRCRCSARCSPRLLTRSGIWSPFTSPIMIWPSPAPGIVVSDFSGTDVDVYYGNGTGGFSAVKPHFESLLTTCLGARSSACRLSAMRAPDPGGTPIIVNVSPFRMKAVNCAWVNGPRPAVSV
jgi:hypothetical protein